MERRSSDWPTPWAIVEIADGSDERERAELIRTAYHCSRAGLVALALRGVSRQSVDRTLDAVVDPRGDRLRAVLYLDADRGGEDLLAVARQAAVVIASTESFRTEMLSRGIAVLDAREGARFLQEPPRPA